MPSMLTSVAIVVCHVSVVDMPLSMEFGLADSDAVGAGGGGGGGGGGGAFFFPPQAPHIMTAPRMNTRVIHFVCGRFTFSSQINSLPCDTRRPRPEPSANISAATGNNDTYDDGCIFTLLSLTSKSN